MSYLVNNKPYELKLENTSKTIWPKIHVDLVSEVGDEIELLYHDFDQDDGNPELDYAGGGLYENADNGDKITPKEAATFEAESVAECLGDSIELPETCSGTLAEVIKEDAKKLLRAELYDLFSRTFAEYAENRLAEEKEQHKESKAYCFFYFPAAARLDDGQREAIFKSYIAAGEPIWINDEGLWQGKPEGPARMISDGSRGCAECWGTIYDREVRYRF